MKVQRLENRVNEDTIAEPSTYPEPGLYLVQEEDGWWSLCVVTKLSVNRVILGSESTIKGYEEVLFPKEPSPPPPPVEPPKAPAPLEFPPELRLFSFSQVLDLLRAARGTDDRRI